jgi:hypothetical protein
MCERQRPADLDAELEGVANGQSTAARDQLLQVLAVDELEDDELPSVGFPTVDDRDDVRMREPGGSAGLAPEALDVVGIPRVVLVEDLDRDVTLEQPVTGPTCRPCRRAPRARTDRR